MTDHLAYHQAMHWMLVVDTCGEAGGVALVELPNAQIAALLPLAARATQEKLMSTIQAVLTQGGIVPARLDCIATVIGPGSFTGVRIGLAAVKGLGEALAKPIVPLSRLAILAAQAGADGSVQAWLDAGRGDVFVGRYHRGICLSEEMLNANAAAAARVPGETSIVMEQQLLGLFPDVLCVSPVGVLEAAPLAAAAALAGRFADPALLDANYLRVPDAQLALQARLAAAQNLRPNTP